MKKNHDLPSRHLHLETLPRLALLFSRQTKVVISGTFVLFVLRCKLCCKLFFFVTTLVLCRSMSLLFSLLDFCVRFVLLDISLNLT